MSEILKTQEDAAVAKFAETLRILREASGLSQSALGQASGVNEPTIFHFEKGTIKRPAFFDVVRLGNYFGLKPEDMADMLGVYTIEPDNYTPRMSNVLTRICDYAHSAPDEVQDELALMLEVLIGISQRRHATVSTTPKSKKTKPQFTPDMLDKLPENIRRKMLHNVVELGEDNKATK